MKTTLQIIKDALDNNSLLNGFLWFALGVLVPYLAKQIYKFFTRINTTKTIRRNNNEYIKSGKNICPLAHGFPFIENSKLVLDEPYEEFYFSMPQEIHEKICLVNPDFEHTNWGKDCDYWGKKDNNELLESIQGITNGITKAEIAKLIESKKYEIANMFYDRAEQAFFNGEMYGIKKIYDRRVGNEESAKIEISSYKTDYYTHRVMASVYQELLNTERIASPNGLDNINNYYPFLTSMGMDVLLVIEDKRRVVLTKRSKQLINMKSDKWHLSMNEAISITDLSMKSIDLEGCVRRGLKEELGINYSKINKTIINFCDLFFLKDPLEAGILAIVVIDEITEKDVREAYLTAQDAPFESTGNDETGLCFLNLLGKDIIEFCEKKDVTDAAKYALKMLIARKGVI